MYSQVSPSLSVLPPTMHDTFTKTYLDTTTTSRIDSIEYMLSVVLCAPVDGPIHQALLQNSIFSMLDLATFTCKDEIKKWTYLDTQRQQHPLPEHLAYELCLMHDWISSEIEELWDEEQLSIHQEQELLSRDYFLEWLWDEDLPPL